MATFGYCAPSIEEAIEGAAELVKDDRYRKIRNRRSYPILARDFLCWSLLAENAADHLDAAWAALYAAWVLDDHESVKGAWNAVGGQRIFSCRRRRNGGNHARERERANFLSPTS